MDVETSQRFAEFDALLREIWADLSTGQRNGLAGLEARLTARIDKLEAKVDRLESELGALKAEFGALKAEFGFERTEFGSFRRIANENFARIQRNFELVLAEVRDPAHKARLDVIEARLVRLEHHVGLIPDE